MDPGYTPKKSLLSAFQEYGQMQLRWPRMPGTSALLIFTYYLNVCGRANERGVPIRLKYFHESQVIAGVIGKDLYTKKKDRFLGPRLTIMMP